ncbi:DUF4397 domain-containing protein [Halalkalibacterium ligniniphilum]|uniref:DUF4397 domain-containing protein n=1 Tax=Halalkalibacterium ligniniphilum TaxID=1134413 RepID=UPI00034BEA23|nr:DUF4397 domain-containing protein [Halalkalibacterium ligniniphilum]
MKRFLNVCFVWLLLSVCSHAGFAANETSAMVRILHASPDAPAVDVYINGEQILTGIEYKEVSEYFELPIGEQTISVYSAGESTDEMPLIEQLFFLEDEQSYTVGIAGDVEKIQLAKLVDDKNVGENETKIRIAHLSPDAPPVNIVAPSSGETLISNLPFSNVSPYLDLFSGTYDFEIQPIGSDELLELQGLDLKNGTIYTAVTVGLLAGEPEFEMLLLTDFMPIPDQLPKTGLGGTAKVD